MRSLRRCFIQTFRPKLKSRSNAATNTRGATVTASARIRSQANTDIRRDEPYIPPKAEKSTPHSKPTRQSSTAAPTSKNRGTPSARTQKSSTTTAKEPSRRSPTRHPAQSRTERAHHMRDAHARHRHEKGRSPRDDVVRCLRREQKHPH